MNTTPLRTIADPPAPLHPDVVALHDDHRSALARIEGALAELRDMIVGRKVVPVLPDPPDPI